MLVVDEYLAVRILLGEIPAEFDPDESFAIPAYRHYRLLQRVHAPGAGQLSTLLSDVDLRAIRRPGPQILQVLDPRPLLDDAAAIAAAYNAAGLLNSETLAAGLSHGRLLWFGTSRNVGKRFSEIANDLGIAVHVANGD